MLLQPPPEGASGSAAGPARTLIVEDDYTSRTVLARLLRAHGLETYSASTVADAFSQLEELCGAQGDRPTYLILDLMLPDGLGTAVLRHIREERLPVHVAVATATNDPRLLSDVCALGPEAVFQKPLDLPKLMQWLNPA
jgi:CheY-like chemotaxis protein